MAENTIAVRLHPQLEKEGRGLCDPEDPRNDEVITPLNYGAKGYLRVYPSGFIHAQIQTGVLIQVPEGKKTAAADASKGIPRGKQPQPGKSNRGGRR